MIKNYKKIGIVIFIFLLFISISYQSFASYQKLNPKDPGIKQQLATPINGVLAVVQVIAVGAGLIMLIILAAKYMLSSTQDKAEIKKHAITFVVGAIIAFAATGIIEIIRKFAVNLPGE